MKKFNFKKIGARAVGVALAAGAGTGIDMIPGVPAWMKSAGKIVVGIVGPEFAPKNNIVNDAGVGLATLGAADFFKKLVGPSGGTGVQGLGDPEYVVQGDEYQVHGSNDAMSGTNDALGDGELSGNDGSEW